MTQKILIVICSPRMAVCGVSDDRIKSLWNFIRNISQRHLTETQSKKMCIGVSYKVLQKEQRVVFVIPKVQSFLLRKSILLRILHWKERKVVSIVAKYGDR